jgi:hypothetical protein
MQFSRRVNIGSSKGENNMIPENTSTVLIRGELLKRGTWVRLIDGTSAVFQCRRPDALYSLSAPDSDPLLPWKEIVVTIDQIERIEK